MKWLLPCKTTPRIPELGTATTAEAGNDPAGCQETPALKPDGAAGLGPSSPLTPPGPRNLGLEPDLFLRPPCDTITPPSLQESRARRTMTAHGLIPGRARAALWAGEAAAHQKGVAALERRCLLEVLGGFSSCDPMGGTHTPTAQSCHRSPRACSGSWQCPGAALSRSPAHKRLL